MATDRAGMNRRTVDLRPQRLCLLQDQLLHLHVRSFSIPPSLAGLSWLRSPLAATVVWRTF